MKKLSVGDKVEIKDGLTGKVVVVNSDSYGNVSVVVDVDGMQLIGTEGAVSKWFCDKKKTIHFKDKEDYAFDADKIRKFMERSKKAIDEMIEKKKVAEMMDADAEFGLYCDALKQLHAKKNHDYGNAFGKIYAKYGMKYALAHMQEKLDRIESIIDGEAMVKTESVSDSLTDLASYALMALKEFTDAKQ